MWHICTMKYYSAIKKKKETLQFATKWMEFEGIEWNKADREKQILHDFTYMWNLKKKTKKIKPRLIENKLGFVSSLKEGKLGEYKNGWRGSRSTNFQASLVAQWLRVCLPMQGTRVRALVWEDPTCRGATRPMSHNYWACASGACAPQQEMPR